MGTKPATNIMGLNKDSFFALYCVDPEGTSVDWHRLCTERATFRDKCLVEDIDTRC